jgi:hypothetical protein
MPNIEQKVRPNNSQSDIRRPPNPDVLDHLSPLGLEHINLTGDYVWRPQTEESITAAFAAYASNLDFP